MIKSALLWGTPTGHGVEILAPKLAKLGINTWCFFGNYKEDDNRNWPLRPLYKQVGTWNPALACGYSPGEVVPLWDMDNPSGDFLAWITWFGKLIGPLGIAPWQRHGDSCSQAEGQAQFYDPEYSNVQMFPDALTHPEKYVVDKGGSKGIQAIYSGGENAFELIPFMNDMDAAIYEAFRKAGCPVVYGTPQNENWRTGSAWTKEDVIEWERRRSEAMAKIGYVVIGNSFTEAFRDPVRYFDKHGIAHADQDDSGFDPGVVILDSDGAQGAGPGVGAWGGHDLSYDQAFAIGRECRDKQKAGFCIISQMASPTKDGVQEYAAIDLAPFQGACEGAHEETPPIEYVTREVCVVSGLLKNPYCPTVEARQFIKGTEPVAVCTVHKAPEPPPPPKKNFWQRLWEAIRKFFGG